MLYIVCMHIDNLWFDAVAIVRQKEGKWFWAVIFTAKIFHFTHLAYAIFKHHHQYTQKPITISPKFFILTIIKNNFIYCFVIGIALAGVIIKAIFMPSLVCWWCDYYFVNISQAKHIKFFGEHSKDNNLMSNKHQIWMIMAAVCCMHILWWLSISIVFAWNSRNYSQLKSIWFFNFWFQIYFGGIQILVLFTNWFQL